MAVPMIQDVSHSLATGATCTRDPTLRASIRIPERWFRCFILEKTDGAITSCCGTDMFSG